MGDEQHQKGGSSRRHDEELIQVDEALRDVTPQAGELPRDAELQMSCGGSCPEEVGHSSVTNVIETT